jgi:tetratricopeptide (TPR) repeat protein
MARWLVQHWLSPVYGAAGEALRSQATHVLAVSWWLRWAIAGLRPDHAPAGAPIQREDWLARTSWRPMLVLLCHFGFEPVQAFRDRYHAQPEEPAASHLCGLWSVGPSTYYRYLDKARVALAAQLRTGLLDAAARMSLRAAVVSFVELRSGGFGDAAREAWHRRQAALALATGDAPGALWHQAHTGDVDGFVALLKGRLVELANAPETDLLVVQRAAAAPLLPRQRCELLLAQAALWRLRGDAAREQALYDQALRIASAADDALMLGRVYGALGKFHEPRDADRAFAFYEDCTDFLWRAGVGDTPTDAASAAPALIEEYVIALVRLAWLFLLRNDPRARATLERADNLRARHTLATPTLAMLEQTWGEYWRRAGELPRSLEHTHRALNLYERAADHQAVLKTCCNLSLAYGEVKDFPRAIQYSKRVLEIAQRMAVDPELVASTHLNLGAAHFWQGDHAAAVREYAQALRLAQDAKLPLLAGRAHYNLAEVAYQEFRRGGDAADERRGDMHAAAALAAWPHETDPAYADATKRLKQDILAAPAVRGADRLAPQEAVLHPAEHAQMQAQRDLLAVPSAPQVHVRAHLGIAQAYLAVAMKEREAALALMQRHGLQDRFEAQIDTLRATWERELTREQQLARSWLGATADMMSAERCRAVLAQVLKAGAINKSGYAALCSVSPATASKHLAMLAERGLLQQTGKGPATRFVRI